MSLPASSPLPKAFRLVREILQAAPPGGLSTKEIVKEAIRLYQVDNPSYDPSSSQASTSSSSTSTSATTTTAESSTIASSKGKGKGRASGSSGSNTRKAKGVNVIPPDHPFVSTSYLKSRVLATLQSQALLSKTAQPSSAASSSGSGSGSSSSRSNSGSSSGAGKQSFAWRLSEARQSNLSTPKWDFPSHWQRLIDGVSPGQLHAEYTANKAARQEEERQRGFESGKVLRTERDIWEWAERRPVLSTNLERLHLNKRRAEKRPKKERTRLALFESYPGPSELGLGSEAQNV
uniref:Uncharacterized protein n=1 Tax=Kwoniella dejecticola CBS 10117 TaxID=1296121 RepID=A0A1A6A4G3_9TREE|nr:uncharacterized protein I303_04269 [Kwoniella dejecticola CBS 10117]OBR84944.1 hypothetical protein I303_04269 [Kwoniella dejecticola CBS 10117]